MKLNIDLLKRSFKSLQIRVSALLGFLSAAYLALPPDAQLAIYMRLEPYFPSAGWAGVIVAIVGIALRAKTTKALADR
jgi:hypothetical protein